MKSGNLNFLGPFGPLQACNGTALPLPLPIVQEAWWAPGRAENLVPTGIRSRTVQPVVSKDLYIYIFAVHVSFEDAIDRDIFL